MINEEDKLPKLTEVGNLNVLTTVEEMPISYLKKAPPLPKGTEPDWSGGGTIKPVLFKPLWSMQKEEAEQP